MARKTKSKSKKMWTPPYNHAAKRFKTKDEWTKADWAAYRKAKREGRIAAAKQAKKQLRGPKGKFASKTPKPKRAPALPMGPAAAEIVGPEETPVWVMEECQPTFSGLHDKVAIPIEETKVQVAQIRRDLAEMKNKLRLAPRQPSANPIETLAIVNRTEHSEGMLSKLLDSAKENPLLALAAIAAAIFAGYMIYRNIRRAQDIREPREPELAELQMPAERPTGLPAEVTPRYGPSKPVEPPSNINLPGTEPAFGYDKGGEGIFS